MNNGILYVVVPCYNEEEMLPISAPILLKKLNKMIANRLISEKSKIVFVDDGSADNTWPLIESCCEKDMHYSAVKLSRNCGHQYALIAGMEYAYRFADAIITIDADLQDDIDCFDKMMNGFYDGYDVVLGVRSSRKSDSFFKRNTAQLYYKLIRSFGVKAVYNHADFRLLSKRATKALLEHKENNVFLRGMISLVGFKTMIVEYSRSARMAGSTKYPLKKMLSLAFDGITSFSIKPIRIILGIGIATFLLSVFYIIYAIIGYMVNKTISGWASTVISIWFFGSLQMISIGVIGEYLGKTYLETKKRPKYFIERIIEENDQK